MCAVGLTIVIFVMWPLLTLPAKVFSKGYFTFWVVLALIWGTIAGMSLFAHTFPYHLWWSRCLIFAWRGKSVVNIVY